MLHPIRDPNRWHPFAAEHARWLRRVYNNIASLRGTRGIAVTASLQGYVVAEGTGGGNTMPRIRSYLHPRAALASATRLNQVLAIYNAARDIQGRDGIRVNVTRQRIHLGEGSTGGSSTAFPALPPVKPGDARRTILARDVRLPVVEFANAWLRMIVDPPLAIAKADTGYVLELPLGACPATAEPLSDSGTIDYESIETGDANLPWSVNNTSTGLRFTQSWNLHDQYPLYGTGVGVGSPVLNSHPAGAFTIGPWKEEMLLFFATFVGTDLDLFIDGSTQVTTDNYAGPSNEGTLLKVIPANITTSVELKRSPTNPNTTRWWAVAFGFLAVIPRRCADEFLLNQI